MSRRLFDHGDKVEVRYTILTELDDPHLIVLGHHLVPGAEKRENLYFLRRHKDGQLCNRHVHDSLDDARACIDRTKLDGLWQDLARMTADICATNRPRLAPRDSQEDSQPGGRGQT